MGRMHTDREYEAELTLLRERVLLMAARVEEQVNGALRAYQTQDSALAERVRQADSQVDQLEVEIDGLCVQMLARRQPVASDLRFVTTILKIVTDLERIGDLATSICKRVIELQGTPGAYRPSALQEMGEAARNMLRDAMDALVAGDARKAQEVSRRDQRIDEQHAALFPIIARQMEATPSDFDHLMGMISISKAIERIADHATNLAEMVVFMVEGRDVRHVHEDKPERKERLD